MSTVHILVLHATLLIVVHVLLDTIMTQINAMSVSILVQVALMI